tara:strand:+ start:1142 stop:1675 length:534 start_codon:yes stop_codon:yes gene_type:complete
MMGVGKTTVGAQLAQIMERGFSDLDALVCELDSTGRTIGDIIREDGEQTFREMELHAFQSWMENAHYETGVLATGGGLVTQSGARALLQQPDVLVIWLTATVAVLSERLGASPGIERPLLDGGPSLNARMKELIANRYTLYESVADIVVDTTTLNPDIIVQKLWGQISKGKEPCPVS